MLRSSNVFGGSGELSYTSQDDLDKFLKKYGEYSKEDYSTLLEICNSGFSFILDECENLESVSKIWNKIKESKDVFVYKE